MDLFSELITATQGDLNIDDNSTLFPLTRVKLALNRAYRKAGGMFFWPETEDARKTSTVINQEYYDYPTNWIPDSAFRLEVDDKMYGEGKDGSPLVFADYLSWRRDDDNSASTDKKWSSQWRRYFIYPVPTTTGDNNIVVWGQKVVAALSALTDITIFSYSMPQCNDAIVQEAVAILKAQGDKIQDSQFRSTEAKQLLTIAWDKIKKNQSKYEKIYPFMDVKDFFGSSNQDVRDDIGNF